MSPDERRVAHAMHAVMVQMSDHELAVAWERLRGRLEVESGPTRRRHVLVALAATIALLGGFGWWVSASDEGDSVEPAPAPSSPPWPTYVPPSPWSAPAPPLPDPIGFVGIPPAGLAPSYPEDGELVLAVETKSARVWVYADGRMIFSRGILPEGANASFSGYLEQRLSSRGVELLRSYLLETTEAASLADALGPGVVVRRAGQLRAYDPAEACGPDACRVVTEAASWLPASAWADDTVRAYVPSEFAVCYGYVPSLERAIPKALVLNALPQDAAEVLRNSRATTDPGTGHCAILPTDQAREVVAALDDAGLQHDPVTASSLLSYVFVVPSARVDGGPATDSISFEPVLPHGEPTCSSCG